MGCELLTSIIGGLIGGSFAILAVIVAFFGQYKLNEWRQRETIQGVLQAIYTELNENYQQLNSPFMEKAWEKFENNPEKIFTTVFPVTPDYLIIYRSNATLIGQIEKPLGLKPRIVSSYMLLQAVMERYKTNNMLLTQSLKAGGEGALDLESDSSSLLREIAPVLKQEHNSFKKVTKNLLKILKKECNIVDSTDDST